MRCFLALSALALLAMPVAAQDTVRIGTDYRPGARPGIVLLPAPGLDSARAILERDLEFSDRFEVLTLRAGGDSGTAAAVPTQPLNYALYKTLRASFAVELASAGEALRVRFHDVERQMLRTEVTWRLDLSGVGDGRLDLHRLADEIVRWGTGQPGIAASRILYVADGRIWRVDSDGYGVHAVTPAGQTALSPAWAPDGAQFAYSQLTESGWSLVVQRFASGTRTTVPTTTHDANITPAFSPDGRSLAFARSGERGTNLLRANVAELCCIESLTLDPFADNLSPAYSPDGRRLAYVSTRAGGQQIFVMSADGTNRELLVPYDYGTTGNSNAPDWSPDGATIAFHRETQRTPQIWVYDLARHQARQLSSTGRNQDPSWAPDGRHLVYVSDRTGRGQLHVIDLDTGRVRQIVTPGVARLPAWSRSLGGRG